MTQVHPELVTEPAQFLASWIGLSCSRVIRRENDWRFSFDAIQGVSADCPWRILDSGRIAYADEDDGQKFGLPKPIIGSERAQELLAKKRITSAEITPVSGDLIISFEGPTVLEFFNNSSGYESWQATALTGQRRVNLVAQGGGQISMWED